MPLIPDELVAELKRLQQQFGPSEEDTRQARGMGLLAAGLGTLGTRTTNPLVALGQGGLLGMMAQQQMLRDAAASRTEGLQGVTHMLALQQALQQHDKQQAIQNLAQNSFTAGAPMVPGMEAMGPPDAQGGMQPPVPPVPAQPPQFNQQKFLQGLATIDPLQALALGQKENPYDKINPKDYTPESLDRFRQTGDASVLRARVEEKLAPADLFTPASYQQYLKSKNLDVLVPRPDMTAEQAARLDLERQRLGLDRARFEREQPKISAGQTALDQAFGKEYADWRASGGIADVNKQLKQLRESANAVETQDLTGPTIGSLPDAALAYSDKGKQLIAARDATLEVAQRNLRLVLGAQFTQKEGEMLLARTWNSRLPAAENAKRITRLADQIEQAAKAKENASNYFEKNGTLTGWNGRLYSLQDFSQPEQKPNAAGGGITPSLGKANTVKAPDGKTYTFPNAAAAAAFRSQVGL